MSFASAKPYWSWRRREQVTGALFALPAILGFLVLVLGPMLFSLAVSFTDWSLLRPPEWSGTNNWAKLPSDESLVNSLIVTAKYTVLSVLLTQVLSLAVALLMNQPVRGVAAFRTFFYLPVIMPVAATSIVWLWFFNPNFGLFNYVAATVGLPWQLWLQDPDLALPLLVLVGLWAGGGAAMVIYLAALQGVPRELSDAAAVDGAGWWVRLRHITIPMVSPVILFNCVMGLIGTFQVFTVGFMMTRGGPAYATEFFVLYLYRRAFMELQMGYAAAMSWLAFVILLVVAVAIFKFSSTRVHYEF